MASMSSNQHSSYSLEEEMEILPCACGGGRTAQLLVSKNKTTGGHLYYKCKSCDFYVWWVADKHELHKRANRAREEARTTLKNKLSEGQVVSPAEVSSRPQEGWAFSARLVTEMKDEIREVRERQLQQQAKWNEDLMKFKGQEENKLAKLEDQVMQLKQFKDAVFYWGRVGVICIVIYAMMYGRWN